MPNPENIIPPKKGEIRNPKGKPKGTLNRSTILNRWLSVKTKIKNPITGEMEAGTIEDQVIMALLQRAIKSKDVRAIQEILDTKYGKLLQKAEVKNKGKVQIYKLPDGTEIKF